MNKRFSDQEHDLVMSGKESDEEIMRLTGRSIRAIRRHRDHVRNYARRVGGGSMWYDLEDTDEI